MTDVFGNPGAAFSGSYTLDFGTVPFPTPLTSKPPAGSLIYDPSQAGIIGFVGDTDSFRIEVDAGQTFTVRVTPDAALHPTIDLTGPAGSFSAPLAAPGTDAVLQTVPITLPGTY